MTAPKGNQFWKVRSTHGRKKIFKSERILWNACVQYFEWVEENPLKEQELVKFKGTATPYEVNKMRAMTIAGLCIFLDIDHTTWGEYRKNEDFSTVINKVEQIIRTQKFEGASAGLLNPNIIARDLGLAENTKAELTGKDGAPLSPIGVHITYADSPEDSGKT